MKAEPAAFVTDWTMAPSERQAHADATYTRLFGPVIRGARRRPRTGGDTAEIHLRRLFDTGVLSVDQREDASQRWPSGSLNVPV